MKRIGRIESLDEKAERILVLLRSFLRPLLAPESWE